MRPSVRSREPHSSLGCRPSASVAACRQRRTRRHAPPRPPCALTGEPRSTLAWDAAAARHHRARADNLLPTFPVAAYAIAIEPGSLLARALESRATVNNYHDRSIDRLGSGVVVTARAPDGVIEAIEVPSAAAPTLGVQWELQEHASPRR
jgi:gamma-glutamyl-gamma-aminobutyrate hydrolase PuuD